MNLNVNSKNLQPRTSKIHSLTRHDIERPNLARKPNNEKSHFFGIIMLQKYGTGSRGQTLLESLRTLV